MTPCARCGAPASTDVWGLASCADCRALWMASERTTTAAVDKALGVAWLPRQGAMRGGQPLTQQEYLDAACAEFRRLARVWSHSAKRVQGEAGAA